MKNIVFLSGAGMSAESGIKTFRDNDGLWENHRVEDVATPEAWQRDRALVQKFYNQRRAQLLTVEPNRGHELIAQLEKDYNVKVVTQNVDDLHERAGSSDVLHLHGELMKVRSQIDSTYIVPWQADLTESDLCPQGKPLRPHIVWFGEDVPMFPKAVETVSQADICVVIGTSMQVYPAASLVDYAPAHAEVYYIDPKADSYAASRPIHCISQGASEGMQTLVNQLTKLS